MLDQNERGTDLALVVVAFGANLVTFGWAFLAVLAINAVLVLLSAEGLDLAVSFILHGLVMFAVMRTLLTGGAVAGSAAFLTANREVPIGYLGRLLLLSLPGLVAFALMLAMLNPREGDYSVLILAVPVEMVVQAAVLAVFGTMLARFAEGKPGRASKAMLRGEGQVGRVFTALITGPCLVELILRVLFAMIAMAGVPTRMVVADAAHLDPIGLMVELALRLAGLLLAAYYATVLTRIYLEQRTPRQGGPLSR